MFILLSALAIILVNGEICYDYSLNPDCYNTTVSDTSIYCRANKTCYSSSLSASGVIDCSGDYACSYAEVITSSGSYISCGGHHGCSYSGDIKATVGNVYCNGTKGCYNVQGEIQGKNVYC